MIVTIGVLLAATVVFLIFNGPDLPEEITELYWVSDKKYMKKPQMLYNIQANVLKRYHNTEPDVLYRADDAWDVATYSLAGNSTSTVSPIQSYYTGVKTVDDGKNSLGLVVPYTISGKQNTTSYLVGRYEDGVANLKLYTFP